jgi:hypothetical protein
MKYALNNVIWTPNEFIRLICTRWDTLDEAVRRFDWLREESFKPRVDRDDVANWLLERYGERIEKYTIEEAGKETNPRRRRIIFWAVRPERCFPQLNPSKVDEVNRTVNRTFWDDKGVPELREVKQHYILWSVDGEQMGVQSSRWARPRVLALQCWCPTTNKEFWIMQSPLCRSVDDALRSMMRLGGWSAKSGPLYRHGDILFERVDDVSHSPLRGDSWGENKTLEMIQAET